MASSIVVLAVVVLVVVLLARVRRTERGWRLTPVGRRGVGLPADLSRDRDHARLIADLRALPDSPADIESRLRP